MIAKFFNRQTGDEVEAVQFTGSNSSELATFCSSRGVAVELMKHGESVYLVNSAGKLRVDLDYWLVFVDNSIDYISNESFGGLYDSKPPKKEAKKTKPSAKPAKKPAKAVKKSPPPKPVKEKPAKNKALPAGKGINVPSAPKSKNFTIDRSGTGWSIKANIKPDQLRSLLSLVQALNDSTREAFAFNEQ